MASPQAVWSVDTGPSPRPPPPPPVPPGLSGPRCQAQQRFFNFRESAKAPILPVPLSAPSLTDLTRFPIPLDYVADQPDCPSTRHASAGPSWETPSAAANRGGPRTTRRSWICLSPAPSLTSSAMAPNPQPSHLPADHLPSCLPEEIRASHTKGLNCQTPPSSSPSLPPPSLRLSVPVSEEAPLLSSWNGFSFCELELIAAHRLRNRVPQIAHSRPLPALPA